MNVTGPGSHGVGGRGKWASLSPKSTFVLTIKSHPALGRRIATWYPMRRGLSMILKRRDFSRLSRKLSWGFDEPGHIGCNEQNPITDQLVALERRALALASEAQTL